MRYLWQHLETILATYKGAGPLSLWLKEYCKKHPKLGSRDRRMLSDMAYAWYRASRSLPKDLAFEERVYSTLSICGHEVTLHRLNPRFPKQNTPEVQANLSQLFPEGVPELSQGITKEAWLKSLLQQPLLFLRIRPQHLAAARLSLQQSGLEHTWKSHHCVALPPATALAQVLPDSWYAVQDYSSQQVGEGLSIEPGEAWWDCCSGAGGKALMLMDTGPGGASMLCTDIRPGILQNLRQRFKDYGLARPETAVVDSADPVALGRLLGSRRFDVILCDAPCTGSGTWARTPEQAFFFKPDMLNTYSCRQLSILEAVGKYLRPGGKIVYATCSVFQQENEDVVDRFAGKSGLALQRSTLINGIADRADSMYVAELKVEGRR